MEQQFIIPESILKPLLQYLAARPYSEVAAAISALSNLPALPPPSTNAAGN